MYIWLLLDMLNLAASLFWCVQSASRLLQVRAVCVQVAAGMCSLPPDCCITKAAISREDLSKKGFYTYGAEKTKTGNPLPKRQWRIFIRNCELPKKQSLKMLRTISLGEYKNNTNNTKTIPTKREKRNGNSTVTQKHKRTGQSAIETSTSRGRKGTQHLSKRRCNR